MFLFLGLLRSVAVAHTLRFFFVCIKASPFPRGVRSYVLWPGFLVFVERYIPKVSPTGFKGKQAS